MQLRAHPDGTIPQVDKFSRGRGKSDARSLPLPSHYFVFMNKDSTPALLFYENFFGLGAALLLFDSTSIEPNFWLMSGSSVCGNIGGWEFEEQDKKRAGCGRWSSADIVRYEIRR